MKQALTSSDKDEDNENDDESTKVQIDEDGCLLTTYEIKRLKKIRRNEAYFFMLNRENQNQESVKTMLVRIHR